MHQTGASSKVNTWKPDVVPWVERWLEYSTSPDNSEPMAYFFWDDEGIAMLMDKYDEEFVEDFNAIFTPVERADIFRVVTCLYFGGIVCIALDEAMSRILPILKIQWPLTHCSMPTLTQNLSGTQRIGSARQILLDGLMISLVKATASRIPKRRLLRLPPMANSPLTLSGGLKLTQIQTQTPIGGWDTRIRSSLLNGRWRLLLDTRP